MKITGDSLVASNNPLLAEGEIGLGRDISDAIPGGFSAAGAINGNLRSRAASILLDGVLGTKVIGSAYDTYTPANDLAWYSIEKKLGNASPELLVLRYTDAMVNTLNITAPAGALATFSGGLITCGETRIDRTGGAVVTPSYAGTSDDLLVFHGGRIMNGDNGSTVVRDETFQSVEVVFNNNIAADEYTVRPSRFLRSLTEGIRAIDVNMTLVFENSDKYSKYTYGLVANNTPGYSFYLGALQVLLGNYQLTSDTYDLAGSTLGTTTFTGLNASGLATPSAGFQTVQINMPKLAFTGLPVALASGRIVVTTTARALKDPNVSNIVTAYVGPGNSGLNY